MAEPNKIDKDARIADLEARLSQMEAMQARMTMMEKVMAMQSPVVTPLAVEAEREKWFQEQKDFLSKTCEERTQIIANQQWKESAAYSVKLVDTKGVLLAPEIKVPSRSKEEAKGRYDSLCGIIGVDSKHRYMIEGPVAA